MKRFTLVILLLFLLSAAYGADIKIYNNIVVNKEVETTAIDYAIDALISDFNRKFGNSVRSDLDPIVLNFAVTEPMDAKFDKDKFDKFQISYEKGKISFTGSDELGLIHAIYTFSEDVLGIDPFIHFSNLMPDLESQITVKSGVVKSKPYSYTHRGFFINDEDLIDGFQMEKLEYGFNLAFMKRIYETLLRLKMTGVIPSTLVLSDEPHLELASDMGLYIMQHHAEPVGSVPLFWPRNEPFSWTNNSDEFIKFWTTAIERQKGKKVIWTLNFRGRLDRDSWRDDPDVGADASDEAKAEVINQAVAAQYELIKKITGDEDPLVSGILHGGVRELFNKGLIKYPKSTMIQFGDIGTEGKFPSKTWTEAAKCEYPTGLYKHVSYHCRKAHMRINLCDPNEQCVEMQKAFDNNMTNICVLNAGNIKEKIFGTHQIVNYMNDFETFKDQKNDEYYAWYIKKKFDSESLGLIQSYKDFINNQVILRGGKPGDEFFSLMVEKILGMAYKHEIDLSFYNQFLPNEMSKRFANNSDYKSNMCEAMSYFVKAYDSAVKKWEVSYHRAFDAQKDLSGSKLDFYKVDLLYPTEKMLNYSAMAARFCEAVNHYVNHDYHEAQLSLYTAIQHQIKVEGVEKKIEENHGGEFKDWYRWDQNAITWQIRPFLENFHAINVDLKRVDLPYDYRNSKTPGIQYKYQPYFKSKYKGELIYMEDGK